MRNIPLCYIVSVLRIAINWLSLLYVMEPYSKNPWLCYKMVFISPKIADSCFESQNVWVQFLATRISEEWSRNLIEGRVQIGALTPDTPITLLILLYSQTGIFHGTMYFHILRCHSIEIYEDLMENSVCLSLQWSPIVGWFGLPCLDTAFVEV